MVRLLPCFLILQLFLFGPTACSEQRQHHNRNRPAAKVDSLRIFYPRWVFSEDGASWRSPAVYSEELGRSSPSYIADSRAQDQEDIWLYENWWYGMRSGVIMESGALDGKMYSTSLLFESFAGWTTINVGECLYISILLQV